MSTDTEYQAVDRTGRFRGRIIEYRPVEGKGKSMSISLRILCTGMWDEDSKSWDDTWEQYSQVADGFVNLVSGAGKINEISGKGLLEHAGWSGLHAVWAQTWNPNPISFQVKVDDYKAKAGVEAYCADNIGDFERGPGPAEISEERAKAFDDEYGSQLRALLSNQARNAAPAPATKPAVPKPAARKASPKKAPPTSVDDANAALQEAAAGDDIPF
jgi:hypothetical protein